MRWTTEQRDAIEKSGNLIVSAAAGAGKTAVLTERVCRLVADGVPVERLLVLTFTRAAAAEMKTRISARLAALAAEEPDDRTRARLFAEAAAVGRANISTIDAFCARILRRHGHTIGLPPQSRVADGMEMANLAASVRNDLLARLGAENSMALTALYRAFGSESAALSALETVVSFLDSQPYPAEWLANAVRQYRSRAYADGLLAGVVDACKRELAIHIDALTAVRDRLTPADAAVLGVLDDDLLRYRAMLLQSDYDAYREAVLSMEYRQLRFPKGASDADKEWVRAPREAAKAELRAQREILRRDAASERALMLRAGNVLAALETVVTEYLAAFAAEKRRRSVLDYADLEHMALKILDDERIATAYREKFVAIAVDEYQDTNRVGEAILSRIARGGNLFLVGDVKQSIYRFRQAEPTLFLEKLETFSGPLGARVDLTKNFRSAREVLDAVNDTFAAIMTKTTGEMDYDDRARLVAGASFPPGGAELHLIERAFSDDGDALEDALDAEVEARLVAARIKALMATETVPDAATGKPRPLRYGDCAVLLRGMKTAQTFARALAASGVPAYAQSAGGYFDALEVVLTLNFLSVIDNRRQDIPLLSAMLSDYGGFAAEELAELRAADRTGSFYECVFRAAETDEKVAAFLGNIARYRSLSRRLSVEALIRKLFDETGFPLYAGAQLGGKARRANLDALLEKAHAFERAGHRDLSAFLTHMETVKNNASVGAAQSAPPDVVRILSMHKSKGLEFPVVALSLLGTRFNTDDSREPLILHSTGGAALRFFDETQGVRTDTAARRVLAGTLRSERLAEEMRVLYVAMTRAKQRLILTGCAHDAAALLENAETAPSPARVRKCASMLGWLVLGARSALPTALHAREELLAPSGGKPVSALPPEDERLTAGLVQALASAPQPAPASNVPAKVSVSRLGDGLPGGEVVFDAPAFISGTSESAAARGSATHALLAALPLAAQTETGVRRALDALVSRGAVEPEQAEDVDVRSVARFAASPLYARLRSASRVERELPFTRRVPAADFYPGSLNETILLQGVIDCCFLENGHWVLLDYKTDRVPPGVSPAAHAQKHARQLALYADALAALTGTPVAERYVVLLERGEAVRV